VLAWRLCRERFADLAGEGARVNGGRWNTRGRPVVYAASNAALAVLEARVNLDLSPELIPIDYVLVAIEVGDIATELLTEIPDLPCLFGDAWLNERRTAALRVPSAIVPECPNILLNPMHPDAVGFKIVRTRHFEFDRCLWLPQIRGYG
jgi:RES domain-containing protein